MNLIKKIFLLLSIIFLFFNQNFFYTFAISNTKEEQKKEIKVSFFFEKEKYDIDEKIKLKINFYAINKEITWKINILWLENFKILSYKKLKSKFSSNDKWDLIEKFQIKLILQAKQSWEYFIWPVFLNKKKILKKHKIKIVWERLFVNWKKQNLNILSLNKNNSINNIEYKEQKQEEIKQEKKQKIDISDMKDIYEIEKNPYPSLVEKIPFFIFIFLLFIFFIFYFLRKKYLLKKAEFQAKNSRKIKQKIDYKKLFLDLEKKLDSLDKQVFYTKITNIFRIFLEQKYSKNFSSKSLEELNYLLSDKEILDIYKKIYFEEYSPFLDDLEYRKKLFLELKKIIINNK